VLWPFKSRVFSPINGSYYVRHAPPASGQTSIKSPPHQ
jgi:hypothetical protein